MMAHIVSFKWEKGETKYLSADKNGKVPRNAIKDEKGKYRMYNGKYMIRIPSKYILTLKGEDDEIYTVELRGIIKYYKRRKRVTEHFRNAIEKYLREQEIIIKDGAVFNIYSLIEKFLESYKAS